MVELKAGVTLDMAALIAHRREWLGPIKAPKSVEALPRLPRNQVGEVLKWHISYRFWVVHSRQF